MLGRLHITQHESDYAQVFLVIDQREVDAREMTMSDLYNYAKLKLERKLTELLGECRHYGMGGSVSKIPGHWQFSMIATKESNDLP